MTYRKEISVTLIVILLVLLNACGYINEKSSNFPAEMTDNSTEQTSIKSMETKINKEILKKPKKENIIQEIKADIDCDKIAEEIIVDIEPIKYARLQIFKVNENREECVFNSENTGYEFSIEYMETNKDVLSVEDENKNGTPEIYFTVCGDGIEPAELVILEHEDDDIKVMFYGILTDYEYIDLNNDGMLELCGCTNWGGEVIFNGAEYSAFLRGESHYEYSAELTEDFNYELCVRAEKTFQSEPEYNNLDNLISRYAKAGLKEKGISTIKVNLQLLNDGDSQYGDEDFFVSAFEERLIENGF